MFRIAILDDDKTIIEQIRLVIENYAAVRGVELITEPFSVLGQYDVKKLSSFDIIILDINMPGINGLQIAKKIRENGSEASIIFCTNYAQYALNGYEVGALGYIIKPITEYSLFKNLDKAIGLFNKRRNEGAASERLVIETVDGTHVIKLKDIVYVEVVKHDLYYHFLKDGEINVCRKRGTLHGATDKLEQYDFVRCFSSYLVNLDHVVAIDKKKGVIYVTGGDSLLLSRSYSKAFFEKFMNHFNI